MIQFTYLQGGGTISFAAQVVATPTSPTQAAFGPDGRLYVGTLTGDILAYTFDDNYATVDVQTFTAISGLSKNNILGIAFNPFDPPTTDPDGKNPSPLRVIAPPPDITGMRIGTVVVAMLGKMSIGLRLPDPFALMRCRGAPLL